MSLDNDLTDVADNHSVRAIKIDGPVKTANCRISKTVNPNDTEAYIRLAAVN